MKKLDGAVIHKARRERERADEQCSNTNNDRLPGPEGMKNKGKEKENQLQEKETRRQGEQKEREK
jgi:hypothetical protein